MNTHRHLCSSCLVVWEHGNDCIGDEAAHACPTCGKQEREWYEGELQPTHAGNCTGTNHAAQPIAVLPY